MIKSIKAVKEMQAVRKCNFFFFRNISGPDKSFTEGAQQFDQYREENM